MANQDYAEKLKDPRWQRLKSKVLERDNFTCLTCDGTDRTLHVHHGYYEWGLEPWEYPEWSLWTLCDQCHDFATFEYKYLKKLIGSLQPVYLSSIVGFAEGLVADETGNTSPHLELMPSTARIWGIAKAWSIPTQELLEEVKRRLFTKRNSG